MVGTILPKKGIQMFTKKFGRKKVHIGFFYQEIVWNILEDFGPKGASVRDISTRCEIPEMTIRKILKTYKEMNRIAQEEYINTTGLLHYIYIIKRRWSDVR